jgi:hypothetical protein
MLRSFIFTVLALLAAASQTHCKAVFAHVIVGNNGVYTEMDWYNDIKAAASALIDGFALNIGNDDFTDTQLNNAYSAAEKYGNNFKLFLSFDYGAVPAYDANTIIRRINAHSGSTAQYNYATGKPLVSTFERPQHAADWGNIKAQNNCFFHSGLLQPGPKWRSSRAQRRRPSKLERLACWSQRLGQLHRHPVPQHASWKNHT